LPSFYIICTPELDGAVRLQLITFGGALVKEDTVEAGCQTFPDFFGPFCDNQLRLCKTVTAAADGKRCLLLAAAEVSILLISVSAEKFLVNFSSYDMWSVSTQKLQTKIYLS
jgi:hypothetical protein